MGKQKVVKALDAKVAIFRDGELIGVGLSREDASCLVRELSAAYPYRNYTINPQPKKKE